MYVTSPVVGFTVTVPFVGFVTIVTLASLIAPSVSVSLFVTSITTGVSSLVVATSSTALGASLTAFTVTVKFATFDKSPPLSCIVYEIDAVPLKLVEGVKVTSPVEVFNVHVPFAVIIVVC